MLASQWVERRLTKHGTCTVDTDMDLTEPIVVLHNQELRCKGSAALVAQAGLSDCVVMGNVNAANYRSYIRGVNCVGGGIRFDRYGQHCACDDCEVTNADVSYAWRGVGDKMTCRRLGSTNAISIDFHVAPRVGLNGLTLEHPHASSHCEHFQAVATAGAISNLRIINPTFQGAVPDGSAIIHLYGSVAEPEIRDGHLELVGSTGQFFLIEPNSAGGAPRNVRFVGTQFDGKQASRLGTIMQTGAFGATRTPVTFDHVRWPSVNGAIPPIHRGPLVAPSIVDQDGVYGTKAAVMLVGTNTADVITPAASKPLPETVLIDGVQYKAAINGDA